MCVMTLTLLFLLHQRGQTALDDARSEDRTDVVAYLKELGESIVLCVDCIIYVCIQESTCIHI